MLPLIDVTAPNAWLRSLPECGQRDTIVPRSLPLLSNELQARVFGHRLALTHAGVLGLMLALAGA